jgi:hypothetical protein
MNHKPELVDEVVFKQRTDESAAAEDRDVLSRLPLEPGDLLSDVTTDPSVAPDRLALAYGDVAETQPASFGELLYQQVGE